MNPSLLFVCSQNICRSVAAEAVFSYLVDQSRLGRSGWSGTIDSAGLSAVPGQMPETLIQEAAAMRGYELCHTSRLLADNDFENFDLLLAMDLSNLDRLRERAGQGYGDKIKLLMNYSSYFDDVEVVYPSTGSVREFMRAFDYIEDACLGLFHALQDGS